MTSNKEEEAGVQGSGKKEADRVMTRRRTSRKDQDEEDEQL